MPDGNRLERIARFATSRTLVRAEASTPATKPHAGFIAASLISGAIALFMASASLREIFVAVNRAKFVPDEAVILNWDFGPARASDPRAKIVSSCEELQIGRYWIMDPEQAKALERDGKLEGHHTRVFYFPPTAPWSTIDNIVAFRIQSPEQFELGLSAGLLVSNDEGRGRRLTRSNRRRSKANDQWPAFFNGASAPAP